MALRLRGVAAVVSGSALLAAGCGTGGPARSGDQTNGQKLFQQKCGTCHTLAAAGTNGVVGPNLDDAFASDRKQGFKDSTIEQVVVDQIRVAACVEGNPPFHPPDKKTGDLVAAGNCMPRNLVKGQDAVDVAAYVASVAGNPNVAPAGRKITATDGKAIFQQAGCTGCHTLKDAGSNGTVGPNLDQKKPPKSLVIDRVTHGKGVMPSFMDKLTAAQIDAVATYVSTVAGK